MSEEQEIEKIAAIISKHHIGCNLPMECNTECAECAASALCKAGYRLPSTANRGAKALAVIEGSLLIDEPEDKRLCFIYRMAHVGRGECKHKEWEEELEQAYQGLVKDNIITPLSLIEPNVLSEERKHICDDCRFKGKECDVEGDFIESEDVCQMKRQGMEFIIKVIKCQEFQPQATVDKGE